MNSWSGSLASRSGYLSGTASGPRPASSSPLSEARSHEAAVLANWPEGQRLVYVLTIPYTPPSLNEWMRWHWRRQDEERVKFQRDVHLLLREKGNVCPRPLATPLFLRAVVMRPGVRRRDSDNYATPLFKWLQDVLVLARYLPDDTADLVRYESPAVVVAPKELTIVAFERRT